MVFEFYREEIWWFNWVSRKIEMDLRLWNVLGRNELKNNQVRLNKSHYDKNLPLYASVNSILDSLFIICQENCKLSWWQ